MTLVSLYYYSCNSLFWSKRVPPFMSQHQTSFPQKRPCTWPPIKITPPPQHQAVSCHHFLAFKRFQSLASWSFRLLLGLETSLVLTLHDFQFSVNPAERKPTHVPKVAMLAVKWNLTSSTEINAIWVRWNKSTCSNLQLMHYISAFTDSHLMDDQNPYMERIEIHPPACRRQKNYQLTWSLPSFSISYVPITKKNQPSNIQHHPTWSNIPPTSSNIPPTSPVFLFSFPFCLCSQGFHCIVLQAFNPTLNEVTNGQWTQRTFAERVRLPPIPSGAKIAIIRKLWIYINGRG